MCMAHKDITKNPSLFHSYRLDKFTIFTAPKFLQHAKVQICTTFRVSKYALLWVYVLYHEGPSCRLTKWSIFDYYLIFHFIPILSISASTRDVPWLDQCWDYIRKEPVSPLNTHTCTIYVSSLILSLKFRVFGLGLTGLLFHTLYLAPGCLDKETRAGEAADSTNSIFTVISCPKSVLEPPEDTSRQPGVQFRIHYQHMTGFNTLCWTLLCTAIPSLLDSGHHPLETEAPKFVNARLTRYFICLSKLDSLLHSTGLRKRGMS
jgi:hypothetical protein